MWAYDQQEEPPAPYLDIVIRHPEDAAKTLRLRAKIDTGADISAIPAIVTAQLALPITSKLLVEGYDGIPTSVATYAAIITVETIRFKVQEVITISEPHALLGRDVLNHFYLQLNGPALNLKLSQIPF